MDANLRPLLRALRRANRQFTPMPSPIQVKVRKAMVLRRLKYSFIVMCCLTVPCACGGDAKRKSTQVVPADSSEQKLFGFQAALTTFGIERATLHAEVAYGYGGGNRYELRHSVIEFLSAAGRQVATLTSEKLTYKTKDSFVVASGNVEFLNSAGVRLKTQRVRYDFSNATIHVDSAYTIVDPHAKKNPLGVGVKFDFNVDSVLVGWRTSRPVGK